MAWEADTFSYRFRLHLPESTTDTAQLRAYAATQDGRTLVAAGKSQFLYVWALDSRKLIRIVQMPKRVTQIREIEFLSDSFNGGANQVGYKVTLNEVCKCVFDALGRSCTGQ